MGDIEILGNDAPNDHIWKVIFQVIVEEDKDTENPWMHDEVVVAAGPDALSAVERVKEYAADEEAFGFQVTAFRLREVKLLAVTDI